MPRTHFNMNTLIMLRRWFCYGRREPVTVQLRSAGAGTWGELPLPSIPFLAKISVPSRRAAENGSVLCAEAKGLALGLGSLSPAICVSRSLKNRVHHLICYRHKR